MWVGDDENVLIHCLICGTNVTTPEDYIHAASKSKVMNIFNRIIR